MRNDKGQFIQGNSGKPPGAKHNSTLLKETLINSVIEINIIDMINTLKSNAINEGCLQSIKMIFEYTLGKPSQMIINQNYEHNANEQVSFNDIIKAVRTNGGNV
jgi:hypothetical protein